LSKSEAPSLGARAGMASVIALPLTTKHLPAASLRAAVHLEDDMTATVREATGAIFNRPSATYNSFPLARGSRSATPYLSAKSRDTSKRFRAAVSQGPVSRTLRPEDSGSTSQ